MRVFHIYRIQRKIRWKFYPALNLCLFNTSQFSDQMKKLTLFWGLNLTLFGVKFNHFFLQIIVANCWTESPLIKMFLPTSSPTTRTPSVKDFFLQNFFRLKLFLFCQNWCLKLWHCGKSLQTRQFDYRLIKCIFLVQFLSLEFIKFTSRTALFSSQIVLDINNFNV